MAFSSVKNFHGEQAFSPVEPSPRHPPLSSGPTLQSVSFSASGLGSPPYGERVSGDLNPQAERVAGAVPPGYVPADVANQRLWAVTTEYENLLRLQKEHQLLTAQRRETEIKHLRAVTEMLTGEAREEDAIAARLSARDQEVAATQKAKQAELELLGAVLVLRDRQIVDLQRMCESKRSQISQFQQNSDAKKGDAWKDVQQLREQILGMESAVGDKRTELRHLAETLDARTRRLGALHAEVAEAEQQVREMAGGPVPMQKPEVSVKLQPQTASTSGAGGGALPTRVEAMQQQLAQAQQALKHMVRANAENDTIVRGMTGMSPECQITGLSPEYQASREEESFARASGQELSGKKLSGKELSGKEHHEHLDNSRTSNSSPIWSAALGHLGISSLPSSPNSLGVQRSQSEVIVPPKLEAKEQRSQSEVMASATVYASPTLEPSALQPAPTNTSATPSQTPPPISAMDRIQSPKSPSSPRPEIDEPWHLYRPHAGDAVDAMVANFVNQPKNRLRRSLFCRTGFGEYLYGTRKVLLRINPVTAQLEAREAELKKGDSPTAWAQIEEFTRRLERAQSQNLQRARDRVRTGVMGKM